MNSKDKIFWPLETTPTFWINHASRLLMKQFEQQLRPLDFGMACLRAAVALEENGPMTQKKLAEFAHIEQPSMAEILSRMERDGFILRSPHSTDKRSSQISLTNKAKEHLPLAKEQLGKVVEKALAGFNKQERELLTKMMQRVVANLMN
jgi:DNA-binding MarR family transcriptional regulator